MSQLLGLPGVEPLPRPTWLRIEYGVFTCLDRRERSGAFPVCRPRSLRPSYALIGGVALAASAASLAGFPTAGDAGVGTRRASAHAVVAGGARASDERAQQGSRVATSSAPAQVAVGDSLLTIAAQSVVEVHGDDRVGWRVRLQQGSVICRVAPRGSRPAFVLHSGDTTLTTRGSQLVVTRDADTARVSVLDGEVRVEGSGRSLSLRASESWPPAGP